MSCFLASFAAGLMAGVVLTVIGAAIQSSAMGEDE